MIKNKKNEGKKEEIQYAKTVVIYGDADDAMLEQFSRALIGESTYPVNIDVMAKRLFRDWPSISNIRQMGVNKTLITFESIKDMESTYSLVADFLLNYFGEIQKWFDEERYKTQRVWLEIFGLPPHA